MTTVRVEPDGVEIDVRPGEWVAEAAWRQGYTWPTKCWGQAECTVCFVVIVDGEAHTVPADAEELKAMRTHMPARLRGSLTRLGCRLRLSGDGVVLMKKGVHVPPQSEPPRSKVVS